MNMKVLWTNYKIYGIIIGIVLGTITYNIITIDFSFSHIYSVENVNFLDSYVFLVINFLKFYMFILVLCFFRGKEKIYSVLLGIEAFNLSGGIVIFIRLHNMLCCSSIIEPLLKIVVLYLFLKNERKVLNKFLALGIIFLGNLAENFLINFL